MVSKLKQKAKVETNKRKCIKCEKDKVLSSNYYLSDELLYPEGRFVICKNCVEDIVNEKGFDGFIIVLRAMNKPFIQDIWNGDYKVYIRQISSLPQYRGLTFDDSVFDKNKYSNLSGKTIEESNEDSDMVITPQMRSFWRGFDDNEIALLENYYQDIIAVYECKTPIQRSLYRNMAITQLRADNAKTVGEFDRLMKTLSALMNDANVKPVQETGAQDGGLSTWGEWIKKIEETEPIPEPSDEFKDVDKIKKYWDKWFVKHFAKIFGIIDVNDDGSSGDP